MDEILRNYQRMASQFHLPEEVMRYIRMLEHLVGGVPRLPQGINAVTDSQMRAIKVLVDYAARNCGGGEDTMGAILYTGAFIQLEGANNPDIPQALQDAQVVALAKLIDSFQP